METTEPTTREMTAPTTPKADARSRMATRAAWRARQERVDLLLVRRKLENEQASRQLARAASR